MTRNILNVIVAVLVMTCQAAHAATYQSANFVVTAATPEIAEQVAKCAEHWRVELAVAWFGQELRNWYRPCPIKVNVGQTGTSGHTSFAFEGGEVNSWQMEVNGTLERVLDSVVPHEVNHTIFASHFRRPLPRWADEGAASLFEHATQKAILEQDLRNAIQTSEKIPLRTLLAIKEYPENPRQLLLVYSQGYSLASFLVGMKGAEGRKVYIQLLQDANQTNWESAVTKNYGFQSVDELDRVWTEWVLKGSPSFEAQAESSQIALAGATSGEPVTHFVQKPHAVVFWANWCGYCKLLIKDYNAGLHPDYQFTFVDYDNDTGREWQKFLTECQPDPGTLGLPVVWFPGTGRFTTGYTEPRNFLEKLGELVRRILHGPPPRAVVPAQHQQAIPAQIQTPVPVQTPVPLQPVPEVVETKPEPVSDPEENKAVAAVEDAKSLVDAVRAVMAAEGLGKIKAGADVVEAKNNAVERLRDIKENPLVYLCALISFAVGAGAGAVYKRRFA